MLRSLLLTFSQQRWLRNWIEDSPSAGRLTSRFVAGRSLDQAIAVCRKLGEDGILASLDHLGENVRSLEEAGASREDYLKALEGIADSRLQATVSVKLTQLGLDLSDAICRQNVRALAARARELGTQVEVDMEASAYTERTLAIVYELHDEFANVRAVIQAYLRRSESDIAELCRRRIPVRLCKGAYFEPPAVAFPSRSEVDANYSRLMRKLLRDGFYPAIASHDEKLVREALAYSGELRLAADAFEFQMLYGIRRDLQRELVANGKRLRLYVPYGDAWYPYFMRRLAERPANLWFVLRNLLRA